MAKQQAWHRQTASECFAVLGTTERGLSLVEVVRRLKRNGENSLPARKPQSLWRIFLSQFQSPLIYILLIAGVVVYFLGDLTDTLVILVVLIINAAIGVFQEGKAQNTLLALADFSKTEATVLREGTEEVVSDREIVPGDIIILREGDKVPADARLFEVRNLRVDESALTGESEPVSKISGVVSGGATEAESGAGAARTENAPETNPADQKNMVFRGSLVVAGSAHAVVVATGLGTIIGGITQKMSALTLADENPFKKNIDQLSRNIGIGVLVVSAIVFGLGLLYGYSVGATFFTAVAVAVSLVPEGLPVVITLILSVGAYRMAKQQALVKNLGAVEGLGQASVIALDKTGTITQNELMVERVYVAGTTYTVTGSGYESKGDILLNGAALDPANHPEILFAGKIAAFCANARATFREKEGIWKVTGDPTEAAIGVFGEKTGFFKDELEQEERQVGEIPFDSSLKYHATLHVVKHKPFLTVVGAPEAVLEICTKFWKNGRATALVGKIHEEIEQTVHKMSANGLRVLAFAYINNWDGELGVTPVHSVVFGGLFGMSDVLRSGVGEAILAAQKSGLQVVMITGDHKVTAEAIAREAGILPKNLHETMAEAVVTSKDLPALRELNPAELKLRLRKIAVFARVSPEDKLDIIKLYKKNGDVVAMTGDGVNDALSLVAADLGISMGKIGTEVSKEAADIVLLDDNFGNIVLAIEEGRNVYHNIKKVIAYLFSTGLGELLTIVGAMLLFLPVPLVPTQILWLNLVTDGFLVAALAFEPKEELSDAPRGLGPLGNRLQHQKLDNKFFFNRPAVVRASIMGVVMAAVSLAVFSTTLHFETARATTMAVTVLAMLQWWNAWNIRSERESVLSTKIISNPYLVCATAIVILLQLFAIYNPGLQTILHTTALSASDLAIAFAMSLTIILAEEVRKLVVRTRFDTTK